MNFKEYFKKDLNENKVINEETSRFYFNNENFKLVEQFFGDAITEFTIAYDDIEPEVDGLEDMLNQLIEGGMKHAKKYIKETEDYNVNKSLKIPEKFKLTLKSDIAKVWN